ncbi:MAG: leucine--tRNA ligase [Candidatus Micrarchaeia archaeon]
MIDYKSIEEKWQKEWDDNKVFEGEPNEKEPYFVTAAFPYVNTALHIGHLKTYGIADILARYKRMRGYNVLFPMGMHATGTPILGFAKRIKNNDKDLIEELKIFHIADEDIQKMTDPEYIVQYFVKQVENDMRISGLSIDWRRKFVSIEPFFSKFIDWQFGILASKGLLVQGKHPVGWCPNEGNPVGAHDTKHDVDPEIEKETAIKFKVVGEDASFACSTYRPETIYGATNVFVNDKAEYVKCRIGNETYYISKGAAGILSYQMKIEVIESVNGSELLKKKCINPVTGEELPVLPGFFVKENLGTGVVMSVPGHAPFDYAAIERLKASNYSMPELQIRKIIEVDIGRSLSDVGVGEVKPLHPEIPALAYLEILHTNVNAIDDMLEFATKLQYREESHWGKMLVKGYEGMPEPEAREKIKNELISKGNAFEIYIIANAPVTCRCGTDVVVKVVDNQWFLNYGDKNWKALAKEALAGMRILPENEKNTFNIAIDWLDLKAVARAQGLGTRLPMDKNYIIESLSDSTIYPAFYTISYLIRNVNVDSLKPEFFDYVFRGNGNAEEVAKETGIDYELVKRCRESFTYWYKYTSRNSAGELIFNHLTMYIFNHAIIFDKEYWPKQIVVNGMLLSEGEKMSKSLGNIVPLKDGRDKYGIDPLRLQVNGGADILSDTNFVETDINGINERLEYIYNVIERSNSMNAEELKNIDYWLYSKLNKKIENATASMDKLDLRDAITSIFYGSVLELKRYFERGGKNSMVVKEYVQDVALMLQPIAPHIAEEYWHMLGNNTFVSLEKWPEAQKDMINEKVEAGEDIVEAFIEDAKNALMLMEKKSGKRASSMHIIIASDWKREILNRLAKTKNPGQILEEEKDSSNKEQVARYVAKIAKQMASLKGTDITQKDELGAFESAKDYIKGKVGGTDIIIESEEESKSQRAQNAMPLKPSIDIN